MIVGNSTNCSARRGRRRGQRCGIWSREILGTAMTLLVKRRRVDLLEEIQYLFSPSAAQNHRGSARTARCRRCAPRCAAEPPAVASPQRGVSAGRQARPRRRPTWSTPCLPPWGEESFGPWRCSSRRTPLSWPCISRSPWS